MNRASNILVSSNSTRNVLCADKYTVTENFVSDRCVSEKVISRVKVLLRIDVLAELYSFTFARSVCGVDDRRTD